MRVVAMRTKIEIILFVKLSNTSDGCFLCLFDISRATPMAYGGSQGRGRIGGVAASLHLGHSNV